MDPTRRRQTLGKHASAALPQVWKALVRKNWSHAALAKSVTVRRRAGTRSTLTNGEASRLLYGDMEATVEIVLQLQALLDVPPLLWTKPVPASWRPHSYPDQRAKARRASGSGAELPELTGTDGE